MTISCIIPVYNGERYIEEAVNSVLAQTRAPEEIIVVNDGSTDNTIEHLQKYGDRIDLLQTAHTGVSDTLNAGIERSSGELIAFLDADDIWLPEKLAKQISLFDQHSTAVAFTALREFASPELTETEKANIALKGEMPGFAKNTCIVRRKVFDTVGRFNPKVSMGDFIDWYARVIEHGLKVAYLDEVLTLRRVHLNNFTREHSSETKAYATILKAHLERQRRKSKLK